MPSRCGRRDRGGQRKESSPETMSTPVLTIGPLDAVDLHLHTLASDGAWTVDGLISYLAEHGFKVAAVCDHDTQRSVTEAIRLGAERGVRVIPGVEMTTWWAERQWHLLVYGIGPGRTDEDATDWNACLAEVDTTLQQRAADARDRYETAGYPLPSLEEIRAGRPLWPFHVLSALIKDGHKPNLKEAAERLVELGGNFTADLPLERVVAAAHAAGGLCVVAHPGRSDSVGVMTEADLDKMLEAIPVDGLEAHYRSYTDAQTALYRRMARDHGLLISCGSDSHALGQPVDPRAWRATWCRDLLGRLGVDVAPDEPGPVWTEGMDPLCAEEKSPETEKTADVSAESSQPGA